MPLPSYDAVRRVVDEVGPVGAYRLLLALLAEQRGSPLPAATDHPALTGADVDGLLAGLRAVPVHEDGRPDHVALGDLHQRLLTSADRRAGGSWFTPVPLVEHLLDLAEVGPGVRVLDPACGAGVFLVAAARRLLALDPDDPVGAVASSLHGIDLDPAAAELTRVVLWLELLPHLDPAAPLPELAVRAGDALLDAEPDPASYDVVVGNPPFLNQLERVTAQQRDAARRLRERDPGVLGPYTDLSAVFLLRAAQWVRPGGRVALVQPVSLLAARDAAGVRARLAETCTLEALWTSGGRAFDAAVETCAPVLRRREGPGEQAPVRRSRGTAPVAVGEVPAGDLRAEWGHLVAGDRGVPALVWRTTGRLGDEAECTADFRDQYYGLAGAVSEASGDGALGRVPLVTTGLIEPGRCDWGQRPTRFLKQAWHAPVVDLSLLDPGLRRWAEARLVPKVLLGTQGRVLEAVADPDGAWLPSVPVISVVPRPGRLWHVLAVLLAPPVSVHVATRYAGTALSADALKTSARQAAELPLPVDRAAWDAAAEILSRGQEAGLLAAAALMCRAYDVEGDEVLGWWTGRVLRAAGPGPRRSGRRPPGRASGR